jgi:hypothetical protein
MINHNETPNKTVDKITSDLKKYKNVAVDEAKQTRLLIRILISSAKEYLKNKDFKLDNEDKEFIKNQSSDILKLIPLIAFQIIPGSTIATPFIVKLGEKLNIKLNTKIPEKYKPKKEYEQTDGEMTELVTSDGTFAGSNIPILDQGMHPRKTQDQTVMATRQTNNPIVRGYRVYYGESIEGDDENLLDEVDMSDAFGYEETEDLSTYDQADDVLEDLGIEDPFERHDRLEVMGFDPKYDNELKQEKKRGKCKNCFTKRRLSEIDDQLNDESTDDYKIRKELKLSDEYTVKVINKMGSVTYLKITYDGITKKFLMAKVLDILVGKKDHITQTFKVVGIPHFKNKLNLDFDYFIFMFKGTPIFFKKDLDKVDVESVDPYKRPSFLFEFLPVIKDIDTKIFKEPEMENSLTENNLTKKKLSEVEKEKMIKIIDEILLKKKNKSDDMVKKNDSEETPVGKILTRNLQSIKRIADKEGIDINHLIKILKTGE